MGKAISEKAQPVGVLAALVSDMTMSFIPSEDKTTAKVIVETGTPREGTYQQWGPYNTPLPPTADSMMALLKTLTDDMDEAEVAEEFAEEMDWLASGNGWLR